MMFWAPTSEIAHELLMAAGHADKVHECKPCAVKWIGPLEDRCWVCGQVPNTSTLIITKAEEEE